MGGHEDVDATYIRKLEQELAEERICHDNLDDALKKMRGERDRLEDRLDKVKADNIKRLVVIERLEKRAVELEGALADLAKSANHLSKEKASLHKALSLFMTPLEEGETVEAEWDRRVKAAAVIMREGVE